MPALKSRRAPGEALPPVSGPSKSQANALWPHYGMFLKLNGTLGKEDGM